jgi:hypothetical protein
MVDVDNLDTQFEDYFKLSFIITKLGNLCAMLGGYFKLYFITVEVGNLDANLEGYFKLFFTMTIWVIYIKYRGLF